MRGDFRILFFRSLGNFLGLGRVFFYFGRILLDRYGREKVGKGLCRGEGSFFGFRRRFGRVFLFCV